MKENNQFEKFESEARLSADIKVTKLTNKIDLSLEELKKNILMQVMKI